MRKSKACYRRFVISTVNHLSMQSWDLWTVFACMCFLYLFPKWGYHRFEGMALFLSILSSARLIAPFTYGSKSPKTDSGVGLTQLSGIWRTNRRPHILRMCPSQFHRVCLARNRTSTAGVLALSAISLQVIFDSILQLVLFNFLLTFSANFHDSQPHRRVEISEEPKGGGAD